MQAIISQQPTGWYVTAADGSLYTDETGHGWFAKPVAREHARRLGGWYERGNRTTVKEVVTGYTSLDDLRAACAAAGITADSPAALDAEAEQLARQERQH